MTEVSEIKNHFEELQNAVDESLPKVDSDLMCDLLTRQQENPLVTPMYMLDVFTKPDIYSQAARNYKTGLTPTMYGNRTHYVTNQKLTLEMLKEISDSKDVLEGIGELTGGIGGWGPSNEQHSGHRHTHDYYTPSSSQQQQPQQLEQQPPSIEKNRVYSTLDEHITNSNNDNKDAKVVAKIHFVLCESCFRCASCLNVAKRTVTKCPSCNELRLESIPIFNNEIYKFGYDPKTGMMLFLQTVYLQSMTE